VHVSYYLLDSVSLASSSNWSFKHFS
jgi:hypothetical protein